MKCVTNQFSSIAQIADQYLTTGTTINKSESTKELSFDEILREKVEGKTSLKFSKHAMMRLNDRRITLSENQNDRLESGVAQAREKGIKESLVLVDSLAFIVNVPSNTVVTAMDQKDTTKNIFTNIDGAVII